MVFSDLFFLYAFLPLCLFFYFIFKKIEIKNIVLIIFSLVFYTFGEPVGVIILLVNVTANYFCSLLICKHKDTALAKAGVTASIIISLSMLGIFKYSAFITENLNLVLPFDLPVPNLKLPIGISFYTFQIISYMLDCYWGKVEVQRNYSKFLMYVSLFPQLVAGPIVRYNLIEKDLDNRKVDMVDISYGISRFAVGLGKKVIIANNLSVIVDSFFKGSISGLSIFGTWYAVILFALQVYYDFSGYSDMAIGLGRIFGFKFNENFNYPFICKNITEFWQRWHISLGSFFRDYLLYIPIFGKRRQYASLFLVWFCTGFWHGASWNFIIWGLYFGIFIFIERKIGNKRLKKIPLPITHIYNKLVIIIGFGIFYFTDTSRLLTFFCNLFGFAGNAIVDEISLTSLGNNMFLIASALVLSTPVLPVLKKAVVSRIKQENGIVLTGTLQIAANIFLISLSSVLLVNSTNNPFLYFIF